MLLIKTSESMENLPRVSLHGALGQHTQVLRRTKPCTLTTWKREEITPPESKQSHLGIIGNVPIVQHNDNESTFPNKSCALELTPWDGIHLPEHYTIALPILRTALSKLTLEGMSLFQTIPKSGAVRIV